MPTPPTEFLMVEPPPRRGGQWAALTPVAPRVSCGAPEPDVRTLAERAGRTLADVRAGATLTPAARAELRQLADAIETALLGLSDADLDDVFAAADDI